MIPETRRHPSELPQSDHLPELLRAAAEELRVSTWSHRRFARDLTTTASQLECGATIEQVADNEQLAFSKPFRGLLRMGIATGELPMVLTEFVQHRLRLSATKNELTVALFYPGILLVATVATTGFLMQLVVPVFEGALVEDVEGKVVLVQSDLLGLVAAILVTIAVTIGAGVVLRLLGGAANFRWLLGTMPVFGNVVRDLGIVEFAGLLSIPLRRGMALPQALSLVGDATADPNVARVARELADGVTRGATVSEQLSQSIRVPATAATLMRWGERQQSFNAAVEMMTDMFLHRVTLAMDWVAAVVPPITFGIVGIFLVLIGVVIYNLYSVLWVFAWL